MLLNLETELVNTQFNTIHISELYKRASLCVWLTVQFVRFTISGAFEDSPYWEIPKRCSTPDDWFCGIPYHFSAYADCLFALIPPSFNTSHLRQWWKSRKWKMRKALFWSWNKSQNRGVCDGRMASWRKKQNTFQNLHNGILEPCSIVSCVHGIQ